MNQDERFKIGSMWLGIAEMNGKEISATSLGMMLDAVSDIPFEKVFNAMQSWIKESKISTPIAGRNQRTCIAKSV